MVVKNLLSKMRNKFNVAVAEVGEQDIHQTIVIGVAAIVPHSAQADSVMEEIRYFIERVRKHRLRIWKEIFLTSMMAVPMNVWPGMRDNLLGECGNGIWTGEDHDEETVRFPFLISCG